MPLSAEEVTEIKISLALNAEATTQMKEGQKEFASAITGLTSSIQEMIFDARQRDERHAHTEEKVQSVKDDLDMFIKDHKPTILRAKRAHIRSDMVTGSMLTNSGKVILTVVGMLLIAGVAVTLGIEIKM